MNGYRVRAALTLRSAEDGGLAGPLPSGTRSLLLRFAAGDKSGDEPVTIGAVLTPVGEAELVPGDELTADALFWADQARVYATRGAAFELCYAGRVVGRGEVTAVGDAPVGQL